MSDTPPPPPSERRATNVRLTVPQLEWLAVEAVRRRCPQTRIIEDALIAAGAPSPDPA